MRKSEFIERYVAYTLKVSGQTGPDDEKYARQAALSYWQDKEWREMGPEECASSDMEYWEASA